MVKLSWYSRNLAILMGTAKGGLITLGSVRQPGRSHLRPCENEKMCPLKTLIQNISFIHKLYTETQ